MMHTNSIEAHTTERDSGRLSNRAQAIMDRMRLYTHSDWTDRLLALSLGFTDMNSVRPRITELIKSGKLEECGSRLDPATNKRVRLVRLRMGQQRLF